MSEENANRLNLFDFFGFPNRQQRDATLQICDISKLHLLPVENNGLRFFDIYFEQYSAWSNHINNFSSHLWLHFLLMHYQYIQDPFDTIEVRNFQSSQGAHKIFFDTFAEDVSLYAVSYFDKHLEMFNNLYDLQRQTTNKRKLSRNQIINGMKEVDELKALADEYRNVEQSQSFRQIKVIRDNFVHNKSSSYHGMDVQKFANGVYASGNSKGIPTKSTYSLICELLRIYEHLCGQTNAFTKVRMEMFKQES